MREFSNTNELISFLRRNRFSRIGIDGVNRSGKSTLANNIAEVIGYPHINLDDYLLKNQGGFLDHLKYNEIREFICNARDYIIEGVCLLDVLKQTNTDIDCLIYVKKITGGDWMDEPDCQLEGSLEQAIHDRKLLVQLIESTEDVPVTLGLAEEIMRYHDFFKPHMMADIVFLRETTNKNRHCDE